MLIIPDHEGESVRQFAERLRLWNPQIDVRSARHTAAKVLRGKYTRVFITVPNAVKKASKNHVGE